MASLDDVRAQAGGAYDSLSDADLADRIYNTHYKDVLPRDEFNKRIGFTPESGADVQAKQDPFTRGFSRYVWGGSEPPAQPKPAPAAPAPGDDGTIQEGHEFDAPPRGTISLLKPEYSHYMDLNADAVARGWGGFIDRLRSPEGPLGSLWDATGTNGPEQRAKEGVEPTGASDAADALLKQGNVHFTPQGPGEQILHSAIAAGAPSSIFGPVAGALGYGAGAWDAAAPKLGLPEWARVGGDLAPALIAPGAKYAGEKFFSSPQERAVGRLADIADRTTNAKVGPDLEQLRGQMSQTNQPPWFQSTPLSLADKGGPLFQGEAERVANLPEEGGAILRKAFNERATGTDPEETGEPAKPGIGTRLINNVRAFLGGSNSRFDLANEIATNQKANASPHYQKAYDHPDNQQLTSPKLDEILQTPVGRQALASARTAMQNRLEPVGDLDAALSEQNGAPASNGFRLRTLQFVKEAIDRRWRAAKSATNPSGEDPVGLNMQRRALINEMDRLDATATYKDQDMGPWRNEQGQVQPRKLQAPGEGESISAAGAKTTIHGAENGKFDVETPTLLRRFNSFDEARAFAQDQWNRNAPGAERTGLGEHAQARKIFSDEETAKESLDEGYKAIKGEGKQPAQIRSEIGERDPGDADMYRQGMRTAAEEEIRGKGGGPFAIRTKGKSLDENDTRMAQFEAAGNPEDFKPFKKSVQDEATAHQTANEILRGSASWRRIAQNLEGEHGGLLSDLTHFGAGAATFTHEPVLGATMMGRAAGNVGRRYFKGLTPEVNKELALRLRPQMSPAEVDSVINEIMAAKRRGGSGVPLGLVPPAMIRREDQR